MERGFELRNMMKGFGEEDLERKEEGYMIRDSIS